jgi:hypothetical protein
MMNFSIVFLQLKCRAVLFERFMKTIFKLVAAAIAFSTFGVVTISGSAAYAGPIILRGHWLMSAYSPRSVLRQKRPVGDLLGDAVWPFRQSNHDLAHFSL